MIRDSDDRQADDRELRALLRDLEPDPALEQRTVAALRDLGLLDGLAPAARPSRRDAAGPRRVLAAAAAVILFTAGVGAGRITAPVAPGGVDRGPADTVVRQVADDPAGAGTPGRTRVVQWF